jgi:hypothetical protein
LAVVVLSVVVSLVPEDFDYVEAMRGYGLEEYNLDIEDYGEMMNFAVTLSLATGVCYGLMGIGLTAGAGALVAHLSKPKSPHMAEASSLPNWGVPVEETPPPKDDSPPDF